MFDLLKKYKQNDHFFLMAKANLEEACNAPANKGGVYIVYALVNGRVELVYIGYSEERTDEDEPGSVLVKSLKESIVNGEHFGQPRSVSWKVILMKEGIDALDVYWYVTGDDNPEDVADELIEQHIRMYEQLPKWNYE